MTNGTTQFPPWWNNDLQLAGPEVNVLELNAKLSTYVARAATVHALLFGKPLVITSGNDGNHVPGSAHKKNAALDLRSHDKDEGEQIVFGMILNCLAVKMGIGVFCERATRSPHWHVEDADLLGG